MEWRLIGLKVIVRSNEDEPLLIGTFEGLDPRIPSSNIPMVRDFKGQIWYVGGNIAPWSQELEDLLNKKTPQEQWTWLSDLVRFIGLTR